MRKRVLMISLALALGGMSTTSFAADGNFYVGAGVGQVKWNISGVPNSTKLDDTDTAADIRFGYVWHGKVDFAVEGGYVDLGTATSDWADAFDHTHTSDKSQGLFAGVKVKYPFASGWYVAARGGLYQGRIKQHGTDTYELTPGNVVTDTYSEEETHLGEYIGVGAGYDFNRQFGVGLEYNYYHNNFYDTSVNFGAATVEAEYRF